jgi:hypothetical protein
MPKDRRRIDPRNLLRPRRGRVPRHARYRKLDILEVGVNGNRSEIKTFYQYYNRDSFFLKVMQIEGNHYGEVYYGTTYQYVYTDLEGERHIGVGVQAPQNSHSALQVPYGLVGIGRSSNYIEHLLIAYPVSTSPNTRVWSPIIPNSQIIVSSYASPSNKSGWTWTIVGGRSSCSSILRRNYPSSSSSSSSYSLCSSSSSASYITAKRSLYLLSPIVGGRSKWPTNPAVLCR